MKKKNFEAIKQQFVDRKRELEGELKRLSVEKVGDDEVQDPGDQAIVATMENLRNSLQAAEIQEYNRLIEAIAKLEDGSYGICIDCDQDISEKRLEFYPNAARCLVCQEAFEDKGSRL